MGGRFCAKQPACLETTRNVYTVRPATRPAFLLAAVVGLIAAGPTSVFAQQVGGGFLDTQSDTLDAIHDAALATPNATTPVPLSNLYATAPGLEQQIRTSQWRVGLLAPLMYNSNAEEIPVGGTPTGMTSPVGNISWAAPLGNLPLRVTVNANGEMDRYFKAPSVDLDKAGVSGRLQYVDPTNDQALSPYFAFGARWDYTSTFADQISARQDYNFGFNKRFNFDGNLRPVPIAPDTSSATVWSFGLTTFYQRRMREPQLSSSALFVIPSVSYAISKDWNASLAVEFLWRWYDVDSFGFSGRDDEILPIGTLEYIIPTSVFGSDKTAMLFGRPALDFQLSYLKVASTFPGVTFYQWNAGATLKMGWQF